jgi:predicted nucleic acid-binding protein
VSLELVVDASVVVKIFVQEELSEKADVLLQRLDEQPPSWFYVPPHFVSECTNIFWKYIRRFNYPREAARRDLASLRALPFQVVDISPLLVLELAADFNITAYDAGYAALAQYLDVPLVTADQPLVRKLEKSDCKVVWLGNLPQTWT